ncbi:hypothetical protein amb3960 [Paramagnetospirillum magneticum AMB-1]|uniref:Uncharacterized protein n=1 Tax=Paramagnetospirillum magneticum (strain ATCC 700264 / AMB-1) TaxID=342108 RepID=Q2W061_PARM1|nr:hypothetical protein amb3960 [Paramagnetospirillum magneticum AMB-1]
MILRSRLALAVPLKSCTNCEPSSFRSWKKDTHEESTEAGSSR